MRNNNKSKIIVALDYYDVCDMWNFVDQISPQLCKLKIGNALFTRYGPNLVASLQKRGYDLFLDLKFFDIPKTVAYACQSAADLGVWMVNVHIMSGERVLVAAREALSSYRQPPLLIGVTVLTSIVAMDLRFLNVEGGNLNNLVVNLTKIAANCYCDGVVCSPLDLLMLRKQVAEKFLFVTPGIRFADDVAADDQKRTLSPCQAIAQGADYLVIGRPITKADDPIHALNMVIDDVGEK